jgi:NhaP-type Na+/H+ or K+/H+ antiporter
MYMNFRQKIENHKQAIGVLGIMTVLGSWLIIPLLLESLYNIAPLDTAFLLTVFWSGIWSVNVLRKKYL